MPQRTTFCRVLGWLSGPLPNIGACLVMREEAERIAPLMSALLSPGTPIFARRPTEHCVEGLEAAHAELIAAIESGKIGKVALREIAQKIYLAGRAVSDGIPFVQKSFDEKIEQTIHHAAAEIEATVTNMAMRLGVESIKELSETGPKLLDAGEGPDAS